MTLHAGLGGIPLVLGGNVFGWTADRDASFAVLDAFYEAGGRMIDTAEAYSMWVPGHSGGESESVIGEWVESRGVRSDMRIASKTGVLGRPGDLARGKVGAALAASLDRLRTDYIDLYYAHRDDPETPLETVAETFGALVESGQVRELGASNFTAPRLAAALEAAERVGVRGWSVLQNQYNLIAREACEGAVMELCEVRGIAQLPFYALAAGFLSGKYRSAADWAGHARAHRLVNFDTPRGWRVIAALDRVATETGASHSAIAIAWLLARPSVAAPIASATSVQQLQELIQAVTLRLTVEQIELLTAAGE